MGTIFAQMLQTFSVMYVDIKICNIFNFITHFKNNYSLDTIYHEI